jgi:hypothetical protein
MGLKTLLMVILIGWFAMPVFAVDYYSQGSLSPNVLGNWNTVRAGGGSAPTSFTNVGDRFIIQNAHSMSTTATWPASGTIAKVIVETGGAVVRTGSGLINCASLDLESGAVLEITSGAVSPMADIGIGDFHPNSTVIWSNASSQDIKPGTYGSILCNCAAGNVKRFTNSTTILGNLTVSNGCSARINPNASRRTLVIEGNVIITSSSDRAFGMNNNITPTGVSHIARIRGDFDFSGAGSTSSFSGSYTNGSTDRLTLEFTGNGIWNLPNYPNLYNNPDSVIVSGGIRMAFSLVGFDRNVRVKNGGRLNLNGFRLQDWAGSFAGNVLVESLGVLDLGSFNISPHLFGNGTSTIAGRLIIGVVGANGWPNARNTSNNGPGAINLSAGSVVEFNSSSSGDIPANSPSGNASPVSYFGLEISGGGNKTISKNTAITERLTLTNGALNNGGFTVSFGNGATIERSGGSLGQTPGFGASVNVEYTQYSANITTGPELPASASVLNNLSISSSNGVTLNAPCTVNGTFTLTNGGLTTTTSNLLSIAGTASIIGGSSTSYVNGPLRRTLLGSGPYAWPVGGSSYLPFTLSDVSGTSPVVTVQAFSSDAGGTPMSPLTALSNTEYWLAEISSGSFSGGSVSLGRQTALGTLDAIARSSTVDGAYSTLGGTPSGNSITSSDDTGAALGYFAFRSRQRGVRGSCARCALQRRGCSSDMPGRPRYPQRQPCGRCILLRRLRVRLVHW